MLVMFVHLDAKIRDNLDEAERLFIKVLHMHVICESYVCIWMTKCVRI